MTIRTHHVMHSNSGDTCRMIALDQRGIILQPDFMVAVDFTRGAQVEALPTFCAPDLGIYAVYASRTHLPRKTWQMIDFLVEWFAAPSWHMGSQE